jgi:hypothetical protein
MTAFLYAAAGLGLYLSARWASPLQTGITVQLGLVVSVVAVQLGILLGARFPRTSAALLRAWAVVAVCVAAAAVAALTTLAVLVLTSKGQNPSPNREVLATSLGALLTLAAGLVTKAGERWTPSWFSRWVIQKRCRSGLEDMPSVQPQLDAYYALWRDPAGLVGIGQVNGWGFRATVIRLRAIAK